MFDFDDNRQHHANILEFLPHLEAYDAENDEENFSAVITYCTRSLRVQASLLSYKLGVWRGTVSNWTSRYPHSTPANRIKVKAILLEILHAEDLRLSKELRNSNNTTRVFKNSRQFFPETVLE